MAEQMRRSKRREILSKKRENMALNQTLQEGAGLSECEFYIPGEEDEYGYEDLLQDSTQTVEQYLNNT